MAYEEYVSLASRARLQQPGAARVWGRDVARGEWEALLDVGLVVPVAERAGVAGAVAAGALVRVDVALEEIPGWVPDISATMEKWCRQI
jgi:origin recognition complex subunit 4